MAIVVVCVDSFFLDGRVLNREWATEYDSWGYIWICFSLRMVDLPLSISSPRSQFQNSPPTYLNVLPYTVYGVFMYALTCVGVVWRPSALYNPRIHRKVVVREIGSTLSHLSIPLIYFNYRREWKSYHVEILHEWQWFGIVALLTSSTLI